MGFKVQPKQPLHRSVSRTIRIDGDLFDKLMQVAEDNNISFNKLVHQCLHYAMDDLEEK